MRNATASLLIAIAVISAAASWTAANISNSFFEPTNSEAIASEILETDEVQAALVARLTTSMAAELPPQIAVPRQTLEEMSQAVLDDPQVKSDLLGAITELHQKTLRGESVESVTFTTDALKIAVREVLVADTPELELLLPLLPKVQVTLPATGLGAITEAQNALNTTVWAGATLAALASIAAFVLMQSKAGFLRGLAFWGIIVAAAWLAVGYAIPMLTQNTSPLSAAVATAAINIFARSVIVPAQIVIALSVVAFVLSFKLKQIEKQRGAALLSEFGGDFEIEHGTDEIEFYDDEFGFGDYEADDHYDDSSYSEFAPQPTQPHFIADLTEEEESEAAMRQALRPTFR